MIGRVRLIAFLTALGAASAPALAQPDDDAPVDPYAQPAQGEPTLGYDDIDADVAQSLHDRGVVLYDRGELAEARTLFIESLERSPRGRASADSLRMLREVNKKLGRDPDDGRPGSANEQGVLDPYASGDTVPAIGGEAPIDPYGGGQGGGAGGAAGAPAVDADVMPTRARVILWSGVVGFVGGMALGAKLDDESLSEGAVVGGVIGAGLGAGATWYLTRDRQLTGGQTNAIISAANWGATNLGFLGDAVTGVDSEPVDVWLFIGAGGILGMGGGAYYAATQRPTEGQVAFTNSLALYGTTGGLLVGVGMSPPESEAYSLNAMFGSLGGLAAGLWLSDRVDMSRKRTLFMDLGAAAGAASTWVLLYPLIQDEDSNDDEQAAGWISTLTLGAGAAVAFYLTRDMPGDPESTASARRGPPPPPALVTRDADGAWAIGSPIPRGLADRPGLSLDLLSGRF